MPTVTATQSTWPQKHFKDGKIPRGNTLWLFTTKYEICSMIKYVQSSEKSEISSELFIFHHLWYVGGASLDRVQKS